MKPKKKTAMPSKKPLKKVTNHKPLLLVDKTVVTTKEKTQNTIQELIQMKDNPNPVNIHRNHTNRFSCREKAQEYNPSPFSSPGGSSISPQCRIASPIAKQEKQKKRMKQKLLPQHDKFLQKKKFQQQKRQFKAKPKTAKEQCNLTYQNFVLKKLDQKKITQLSQESELSVTKFNKTKVNIRISKEKEYIESKTKYMKVKELKDKIAEKYKRELPSLKIYEIKFYCSIVLIQRLWRQKRIKNFISQFISPRSSPQCNITAEIHRQNNVSRLETTVASQQQTSQLLRKYRNLIIFQKKQELAQREIYSAQMNTIHIRNTKTSLKDLEISAELTPEKEKKFIRFVECVRDINFAKPNQLKKKKNKINVFNLEQSLSQKCLMQYFYSKVFKDSPTKVNNFEIFNSKIQQKQLQRSIQLINIIKSSKQAEAIEIQERFQTQLHSQEAIIKTNLPKNYIQVVQKVESGVDTQGIEGQLPKQSRSLKEIHFLSQQIIMSVLSEFCEQFHAFTSKNVLKKQKKNTLPGLTVTSSIIEQYLTGLTDYMMKNYQTEVIHRFSLINPLNFLKIHHQYDEEDDFIQEDQDEMPIIPNTLFYQYQLLYESQKFIVKDQHKKKFSNFLQSLIKIQNLLLSNCLSQILEKKRVDRMVLPWDTKFNANRHKNSILSTKSFEHELNLIINALCGSAFLRLGQFHKKLDDVGQQQKLLSSIRVQYKQEGSEWSTQYESLELRMDITKYVQQFILQEMMQDIMIFF